MRVTATSEVISVLKDKAPKSTQEVIAEIQTAKPDVVVDITWVQGHDKFIKKLMGTDQESDEWWDYYQRKGQE